MLAPTCSGDVSSPGCGPTSGQSTNPAAPATPTTNVAGTKGKAQPMPLDPTHKATNFVDITTDQVVMVQQNGTGTGLVVNNLAGGKIASLQNNGVEKLRVDGMGNITTFGSITLPRTTGPGVGVINLGVRPFLHACCGIGNTFVGLGAGNFASTGIENTAVGAGALQFDVGQYNTAIGYQALRAGGKRNTAIGSQALYHISTGIYNTASGSVALYSNDSGNFNSAFGTCALLNTFRTSSTPAACGLRALPAGSGDTAMGYLAGQSNTTGR